MKIYVGNLSYDATENDLRKAFEPYGAVSEVIIIEDRFSGRPKGFGFVEMPTNEEAEKAIAALNGHEVLGRAIRVNKANPRGERPSREGGGGGYEGGGGGGRGGRGGRY